MGHEGDKTLYYCVVTWSPLAVTHQIVSLNIILNDNRVFLAKDIFRQISENTDIVHSIKKSLDELTGNKSYGIVLFDSQTHMLKDISTYSDYDEVESEFMETQHSTYNLQDDLESELVETQHTMREIKPLETKLLISHQPTQSVAGLEDVNFAELNAEPSEGSFVITNYENVANDVDMNKKTTTTNMTTTTTTTNNTTKPKKLGMHKSSLSFQASVEGFNLEPQLAITNVPHDNETKKNTSNKQSDAKQKQKLQKRRHLA